MHKFVQNFYFYFEIGNKKDKSIFKIILILTNQMENQSLSIPRQEVERNPCQNVQTQTSIQPNQIKPDPFLKQLQILDLVDDSLQSFYSSSQILSSKSIPQNNILMNQSERQIQSLEEQAQIILQKKQQKGCKNIYVIVLLLALMIILIKSTNLVIDNYFQQKYQNSSIPQNQFQKLANVGQLTQKLYFNNKNQISSLSDPQVQLSQKIKTQQFKNLQETNSQLQMQTARDKSQNSKPQLKESKNKQEFLNQFLNLQTNITEKLDLKLNKSELKQNYSNKSATALQRNQTQIPEQQKDSANITRPNQIIKETITVKKQYKPQISKKQQPQQNYQQINKKQTRNQKLNNTINDNSRQGITAINQINFENRQKIWPKRQNKEQQFKTNSLNFTLRKKFRQLTPPIPPPSQDRYEYNTSADDLVANSALKKKYKDAFWLSHNLQIGVAPAQLQRAIRLLELTHNINFRGQFVMDHYNFYSSPKEKYETLNKLIDQEKAYYEKTYQISKYIHDQVRFCVYVPSFNNAHNRLYLRNLDSIFQQEYTNYHVVYVNDGSTDKTGQYVQKYMIQNQIPPSMYKIVHNQKNMGASHNIYVAGNNFCKPGEIMVLIEGDDMAIGRQVFSLLNAYYQQHKPAIVYTQFLFIHPDHVGNSTNRQIDQAILKQGTWRTKRNFVTWHLKTFYTDLFRMIKKKDMKFGPNEWIPHSSDVAYMTPMIEMAGTRLKFLTQTVHEYRRDTGLNQQPQGFSYSNPKIFQKTPYKYVQNLPFTLDPITRHYENLPDEDKKLMQQRQDIQNVSVLYYKPQGSQTKTPIITINQSKFRNQKNPSGAKKEPSSNFNLENSNSSGWKLRQGFRQQVAPVNQKLDLYEFKQSADQLVQNSALKKAYNDSPWLRDQSQYGVGPEQHERAIRLMQVTHNINFKGEFVFDHFNHYTSAQQKYRKLKKLLDSQKDYYESKYQISKYIQKQMRFCVVVVSYNNINNRIYLRNLDSIFQQEYKNYHLVYINDASVDGTQEYVKNYMKENQIPSNFYKLINNQRNMLSSHIIYIAAHNYCQAGEIMALVDGDDALIGRQVFSLLNAFYQKQKPALVYTQLLFVYPNHIGNSRNQPINTSIFENTGAWRKQHKFSTSHLKTFYVDLFRMIKKEDLQLQKDQWIPHSSDVAFMTPMLQMAGSRVKFLTEITYEYRHDTNSNQQVSGFRKVNPKIFAKKPYSLVKDLPFADNPTTTYYP